MTGDKDTHASLWDIVTLIGMLIGAMVVGAGASLWATGYWDGDPPVTSEVMPDVPVTEVPGGNTIVLHVTVDGRPVPCIVFDGDGRDGVSMSCQWSAG